MSSSEAIIARLENYTLRFPQEVLLIQAEIEDESDTIIIFKGFSSSLVRPTAYDPEIPTLPESALIHKIDRLKGPYQPQLPEYIERGISLKTFKSRLTTLDLWK